MKKVLTVVRTFFLIATFFSYYDEIYNNTL